MNRFCTLKDESPQKEQQERQRHSNKGNTYPWHWELQWIETALQDHEQIHLPWGTKKRKHGFKEQLEYNRTLPNGERVAGTLFRLEALTNTMVYVPPPHLNNRDGAGSRHHSWPANSGSPESLGLHKPGMICGTIKSCSLKEQLGYKRSRPRPLPNGGGAAETFWLRWPNECHGLHFPFTLPKHGWEQCLGALAGLSPQRTLGP